ncbi:hemojuvelin [Esox lucius]|uniref:Hemojuvelin BMP co-receptor n=1 Tax=Esox lucius TaxID=8010 RepID=A0AAY5KFR3_ESOLU|nr:hemojuvelin [Esox lucius]XP_010899558.2 hemojuvelin [Esox lucius]
MGTLALCGHCTKPSWKHRVIVALLLLHLCCLQVRASCRILRCNSDFVAATLDLGGSGEGNGGGGSREEGHSGYCSALRSYAMCTRRTARACRGDLAYHSAVQGIEDLLIQHRCPRTGPTAQPRPLPQAPISGDACVYEKGDLQREGRAPDYLHCGVFGDSHVRTFYDEFQTCAVQGAWPLIDNEYLYVQATSSRVREGLDATALTKITIIFKNWRQCIEHQMYQAELDNVPAAFMDGSVTSGERQGRHSLSVYSDLPGRRAEIRALHIGTTLVVRQSGRSLGLSVRLPRAIAEAFDTEQDLQLCVYGCPHSQLLETRPNPSSPLSGAPSSSPVQPSVAARAHCADLLPGKDIYYQACLFDVGATGDFNWSTAAVEALEDARRMISDPRKVHLDMVNTADRSSPCLPVILTVAMLSERLGSLMSRQCL